MQKKRLFMKELLLPLLKKSQKKEGCISEKAVKEISKKTGIPVSRVYGAATFYAMLHTSKQGRYVIEICNSPSCYLNGSLDMIKYLEKKLNIKSGQTTEDNRFSMHIGSCIGCCNMAPAMRINSKVYSKLTEKKIDDILKKCK
ncbi:NADH-quinone oxidoreductase subunit E [Candidatus Woesearchaeota archaeon]|nr:NADH-quinone oxidoreductase subunit E [Candidatus Woesearchaeota archaeon]